MILPPFNFVDGRCFEASKTSSHAGHFCRSKPTRTILSGVMRWPHFVQIVSRHARTEKMYMKWEPSQALVITEKPPDPEPVQKPSRAQAHMARNCLLKFKPGDEIVYSKDLGAHSTFYRWRDDAVDAGQS